MKTPKDWEVAQLIEEIRAESVRPSYNRLADMIEALWQNSRRYVQLRKKAFWEDERDFAPGGRWFCIVVAKEGKPSLDRAIDDTLPTVQRG